MGSRKDGLAAAAQCALVDDGDDWAILCMHDDATCSTMCMSFCWWSSNPETSSFGKCVGHVNGRTSLEWSIEVRVALVRCVTKQRLSKVSVLRVREPCRWRLRVEVLSLSTER